MTDETAPTPTPTEAPTESHGVGRRVPDRSVPIHVFFWIGNFVGTLSLIYYVTSDEDAGSAMLGLASILALWIAGYLWLGQRHAPPEDEAAEEPTDHAELYLPHASVWPLAIGSGAFLLANGLLLGPWFWFPGAALFVTGLAGFIRQSRLRA